ncbi:hypothetical protein F511_23992 [Dorcoceras hygrometricum]|uniref:Uncharacterized protein n=1 Tax=Dorcoceras hygrometricum TaxID=472368 RepID=A0A2Z7CL09_9LAMI|nr:hypothetical protein F511_23992 [Dorcoceras hygrometricum]
MAQYQILARKPLRPSGTGPKTLGVENSVATPPRDRRTVAARRSIVACTTCGTLPHAASAPARNGCAQGRPSARTPHAGGRQVPRATMRDNRARWPAIGTVAACRYSAHRAHGRRTLQARFARRHARCACKNQLVMVSVQYGPFNTYIPIRSTTIGKSRVARDPIAMHTSRRSNSDIACVTRVLMTFRVVRTNQYNQDLGLIHSTNGNHLESPNEGSSIDHQVTIHMHAQNITMFPTNETWYFTSQMLVSSSGGLILILTAQSTRNEFRIHSDY